MEICRLEHIRKDYHMGELVTPLKDVTLTVNSGDFIAVEGPSGIGKSTLLYVMGTLLKSDGGTYLFEGKFYDRPSVLYRYVMRLDGFTSYKGTASRKVTTKTLTFQGSEMYINFKKKW